MNYTYTKLYEMTAAHIQFDLYLRWASEKFGEGYSQLANTAGTWHADIGYHDQQLRVEYSFTHEDDHAMFILACGGN